MLISKEQGWRVNSYGKRCSASEDHYTPQTSAVYSIINQSPLPDYVFYPAFARENEGFSADSELGRLKPNDIRNYSGDTGYWKAVGIKNGSKIRVGFFDEETQQYVACSDEEVVAEDKTFVIKADKTCAAEEEIKPMAVGVVLDKKSFTVDEANNGITIRYKAPEAAPGKNYTCLFAIKSDLSSFGGYNDRIEPGSEGEKTLKLHKSWNPKGGDFIVGISKNCNNVNLAKPEGVSERITVTP